MCSGTLRWLERFDRRNGAGLAAGEDRVAAVVAQPGVRSIERERFGRRQRVTTLCEAYYINPVACTGAKFERVVVENLPIEDRLDRDTVPPGLLETRRGYGTLRRDTSSYSGGERCCRGQSKRRIFAPAAKHVHMLTRVHGGVDRATGSVARGNRKCIPRQALQPATAMGEAAPAKQQGTPGSLA